MGKATSLWCITPGMAIFSIGMGFPAKQVLVTYHTSQPDPKKMEEIQLFLFESSSFFFGRNVHENSKFMKYMIKLFAPNKNLHGPHVSSPGFSSLCSPRFHGVSTPQHNRSLAEARRCTHIPWCSSIVGDLNNLNDWKIPGWFLSRDLLLFGGLILFIPGNTKNIPVEILFFNTW